MEPVWKKLLREQQKGEPNQSMVGQQPPMPMPMPPEEEPPMENVDPRIMEYLQGRTRDQAPNNQMYAAMAQAASAAGTLGGKQADTSSVQNWAKGADASNVADQQASDLRSRKLGGYLAQVSAKNQARKQAATDRDEGRTYDEKQDRLGRKREGIAAKAARKLTVDDRDEKREYQEGRDIDAHNKKKEIENIKKGNTVLAGGGGGDTEEVEDAKYYSTLKGMGAEAKQDFDLTNSGLAAVEKMAKALENGDFTESVKGDNKYTMYRRLLVEAIGRINSGGAIGKEEDKNFSAMAPGFGDSTKIQAEKLRNLYVEMSLRIRNLGVNPKVALRIRRGLTKSYDEELAQRTKARQKPSFGAANAAEVPTIPEKPGEKITPFKGKNYKYVLDENSIYQLQGEVE